MAAKSKKVMQNGNPKENNAFQRILHLPVVNSACNSLQKTYATTKEAHPLVGSLCTAYERSLQSASSLAAWSVRPVVRKLEPHFAAANTLACQGLDHLEQTIPALHKPVEEVTSTLKESILIQIQKSVHTVVDILKKAMGQATETYEWPKNSVKASMACTRSSRVSHMVEAGGEGRTGRQEKLVDIFPKKENPSAHEPSRTSVSKEIPPTTTFRKVRVLATSVSQHVYKQTVQAIQLVKAKGKELAVWIPTLTSKGADLQGMLGRLAHNLHTAYLSSILLVKNAPCIAWSTVGQLLHVSTRKAVSEAGANVGILQGIASKLLGTIIHYIHLPEVLESEEEATTGDQAESIQEEEDVRLIIARQLQDRRRSSRGHYPIPFLNLDDPLPPQQAPSQRQRSPVSEAEQTGSRKSALSPYKEGAGTRRWSEGLFRPPPEGTFTRHTGLYSVALKKD